MSTRGNYHFNEQGETQANVYVHSDNYPEYAVPRIYRFFNTVKAQTNDTRFDDSAYLPAKFVVFMANEMARSNKPLDFLSVGIMKEDAGDSEYIYTIDCSGLTGGFPKVTGRSLDGDMVDIEVFRDAREEKPR